MKPPLFDDHARTLRKQRAARLDGDRFLHERAFDDCLDRLADVAVPFEAAVIIGGENPGWRGRLGAIVPDIRSSQGSDIAPASVDLCLSIGDLDSANDVQATTFALRHLLRPGGLLLGAIVGGNSLPRLRAAMLAADRVDGGAAPRLHPSIDGPSLAALLVSVGFSEPVIDVDRVAVTYSGLDSVVADLRAMGCTNILDQRSKRPIGR
ncbi:MAG: hypothetical protein ABI617_04330, partial [Sphingomicrobium sp.]